MPLTSARPGRPARLFPSRADRLAPSPPVPPPGAPPPGSGGGRPARGGPGAAGAAGRADGRSGRAGEARRPGLAAAGVLLVLGCAGLGAAVAHDLGRRTPYLEIARFVPDGSRIVGPDLASTPIAGGGTGAEPLAALPSSMEGSVLGRRAAVPLEPGTLLVPADLAAGPAVPAGQGLVGATLAADQLPPTLVAGDRVLLVLGGGAPTSGGGAGGAGAAQAGTAPAGGLLPGGTGSGGSLGVGTVEGVSSIAAGAGGATELVTLEVPIADAVAVAEASASSEVSLVEIGGTGA